MDEAINKSIDANRGVDVPEPASTATATLPPVSFQARFFWGIGSLGTITYLNIVTALVMVYLTSIVQLDASVAGTLVFIARIVDAFMDPGMGWVTDHTKTRWGRRRPYLLLGAVVCAASLPLVFSVHALPVIINPATTVLLCLIVYSLGFTIFNVPYLAMPVEMTTDRMQALQRNVLPRDLHDDGRAGGQRGRALAARAAGSGCRRVSAARHHRRGDRGARDVRDLRGHAQRACHGSDQRQADLPPAGRDYRGQPSVPAADRREGAAVLRHRVIGEHRGVFCPPSC